MATQQQQGIGTLAYPFYVNEFGRDPKPVPTTADATLYCLETRETFVWKAGNWILASPPVAFIDPAVLEDMRACNRLILRELRLIRQGQMKTSVCADYDGAPEELDEPGA